VDHPGRRHPDLPPPHRFRHSPDHVHATGDYSQPRSRAIRTAVWRLSAESLVAADDR